MDVSLTEKDLDKLVELIDKYKKLDNKDKNI